MREGLFSTSKPDIRHAEKFLTDYFDKIASCKLFDRTKCPSENPAKAFPHKCRVPRYLQKPPIVVEDQQLRNLRHKDGQNEQGGAFAYCKHCLYCWTNEEFVESYLVHGVRVPGLTAYPEVKTRRLKAMAIEYQKSDPGSFALDSCVVDAGYSHHVHAATSCFGKKEETMRNEENW